MSNTFREQLQEWADAHGVILVYVPEVASTNLTAREGGCPAGTLVTAEYQTAGRGQRGNRWQSHAGENLTFSVVLEPGFLVAEEQFCLSKVASLALTDTLADLGVAARIKWPNDIYVGDRKIAGILIENDLSGSVIRRSILGIGLNVNQTSFPAELPNPTSVTLQTGMEHERARVLATCYDHLCSRYAQLAQDRAAIDRAYLKTIYRLGEEFSFVNRHGDPFRGTILGALPTGELQLRHSDDGTIRHYLFKEIEYIIP